MINTMYRVYREVCLLMAGVLLGIILPNLILDEYSKDPLGFYIFIILLILIGTNSFGVVFDLLIKIVFAINKMQRLVAIHSPHDINSDTASWVGVNLDEIIETFKKEKIQFFVLKSSSMSEFPIVVNPYGGVYPEKNISNLASLESIFTYVKNGGIYVNIADIPFYYAYDNNLTRKIDTTPMIGNMSVDKSFFDSLISKKLHAYVLGVSGLKFERENIRRVISLRKGFINYWKENFPIKIKGIKDSYSPFFAIPYGRGYFVLSTIEIKKDNIKHIVKIIKEALKLL
jgi:hypothetical protein